MSDRHVQAAPGGAGSCAPSGGLRESAQLTADQAIRSAAVQTAATWLSKTTTSETDLLALTERITEWIRTGETPLMRHPLAAAGADGSRVPIALQRPAPTLAVPGDGGSSGPSVRRGLAQVTR